MSGGSFDLINKLHLPPSTMGMTAVTAMGWTTSAIIWTIYQICKVKIIQKNIQSNMSPHQSKDDTFFQTVKSGEESRGQMLGGEEGCDLHAEEARPLPPGFPFLLHNVHVNQ